MERPPDRVLDAEPQRLFAIQRGVLSAKALEAAMAGGRALDLAALLAGSLAEDLQKLPARMGGSAEAGERHRNLIAARLEQTLP